jgi:Arc/MetJ family transcription regulator
MRTNIHLSDELVGEARKYSKARSKRALVEEALATYIAVKGEERKRLTYRERLENLRAKTAALRLRTDTRDIVRKDRDAR